MNEKPLVSATILTYNSAETIEEALESIKNQTYDNLELVISDDGSKDNTVSMCEKWAEENHSRFRRIEILRSDSNVGISANVNRCLRACKGEWAKSLAADDIMMPDCISTYVDFVLSHPEYNIVLARLTPFRIAGGKKELSPTIPLDERFNYIEEFNNCDAHGQFRILLRDGCFLQAPTVFRRVAFTLEHPYNGIYKYEEDYPYWLMLTNQGYKLHILFKETVQYRIGNSLSHRTVDYYSRKYMSTRSLFFWNECYEYFRQENLLDAYNNYRRLLLKYELTEAFTQNKRNIFNSLKVRIMNFFVDRFSKYDL